MPKTIGVGAKFRGVVTISALGQQRAPGAQANCGEAEHSACWNGVADDAGMLRDVPCFRHFARAGKCLRVPRGIRKSPTTFIVAGLKKVLAKTLL